MNEITIVERGEEHRSGMLEVLERSALEVGTIHDMSFTVLFGTMYFICFCNKIQCMLGPCFPLSTIPFPVLCHFLWRPTSNQQRRPIDEACKRVTSVVTVDDIFRHVSLRMASLSVHSIRFFLSLLSSLLSFFPFFAPRSSFPSLLFGPVLSLSLSLPFPIKGLMSIPVSSSFPALVPLHRSPSPSLFSGASLPILHLLFPQVSRPSPFSFTPLPHLLPPHPGHWSTTFSRLFVLSHLRPPSSKSSHDLDRPTSN